MTEGGGREKCWEAGGGKEREGGSERGRKHGGREGGRKRDKEQERQGETEERRD